MAEDVARDQLEDIELGTAILGLICLVVYATGVADNEIVLMTAIGLMIVGVGADELLDRILPGEQ